MMVLAFLGLSALPVKDGKIDLSEEQTTALNDLKDGFAEAFIQKANEELDAQAELNDARTQLQNLLAEADDADLFAEDGGGDEDEDEQGDGNGGASASSNPKPDLMKLINTATAKINDMEAKLNILQNEDEPDPALKLNQQNPKPVKLQHSKTHLFASGQSFDALDGRPWNQRAYEMSTHGKSNVGATDWSNAVNIQRVNEDFGAYWAINRNEILDIMRDMRGLPANWSTISNVDDEIRYAAILSEEITQARKRGWLPKNLQKVIPLVGKVFPVQIDIEFDGFELQQMETSWMNTWNREGSQPFKASFVAFLMRKLLEKAREEDKICAVRGVHFPNPDTKKPGPFINRSNGVLKILLDQMYKTYKPFKQLGKPTTTNIVDYVKAMCEGIPEEKRNMPGLYLYMSPTWRRRYYERRKLEDGLMPTYDPNLSTVESFPNIRLAEIDYLDGYDFFFITTSDNIKLLENVSTEKALMKMEALKRQYFVMGDYKFGAHVEVTGTQWEKGVIPDFNHQIVWSNEVPILHDVSVPVENNATELSAKYHFVLLLGENTEATSITNIKDAKPGQTIILKGNGSTHASTIANGGNFDLTGNITLSEGVTLTLFVKPDGKFVEISRSEVTGSAQVVVNLDPNATTADANDGTYFITGTNTGATNITDILNAVDGEQYTIEGGGGTPNATTVNKTGKFARIASNKTLTDGATITVMYLAATDEFIEIARS
ncbi:MAG: hypothetical protein LAT81_08855 [Oceanicaulis sp.]|nr:hypothetical protein [Oceanicaulis sp.]